MAAAPPSSLLELLFVCGKGEEVWGGHFTPHELLAKTQHRPILLFAADLHFLFPLGLRTKAPLLRGRKAKQAVRGKVQH